MGRSKRKYNQAKVKRTSDKVNEVKKDVNKNLAYVPKGFISWTDAQRQPYSLSELDLEEVDHLAVYGERKGQPGLFYPPGEIKALAADKKDQNQISDAMISEASLIRQLPKDTLDIKALRSLGLKGRKSGHKGRPTNFYTVDTVEQNLGVKVLDSSNAAEGIDYIRERCVPIELKLDLPIPTWCIWSDGTGRAEQCYLQPQVEVICDNGGYSEPPLRRSSRVKSSDADLNACTGDNGDAGEQLAEPHHGAEGVEEDPVEEPQLWWQQDENWNSLFNEN